MTGALRLVFRVIILAAVLLTGTAYPGDEDSKPGYMIYIDPETGKYTTEDPDAGNTNAPPVVPARPASGDSDPGSPLVIVIGGVLAVLLVGVMLKHQRRQQ